jgi:hypothetical protein
MNVNPTSIAAWRRLLLVTGLAFIAVFSSGCILVAAGAGAGAVAYARGELEGRVDGEFEEVVVAARAAVTELEFARVGETKEATKAVLISRTPLDKKVEITLANSGNELTSIKIRIGMFGDEQLSRDILDRIKARL